MLSKDVIFSSVVKIVPDELSQKSIRGHCISISSESPEHLHEQLYTAPFTFAKHVDITFIGQKYQWQMIKNLIKNEGPLSINLDKCLQWLRVLKKTAPEYHNIVLPSTSKEMEVLRQQVNEEYEKMLKSVTINDKASTLRIEQQTISDITKTQSPDDESNKLNFELKNIF